MSSIRSKYQIFLYLFIYVTIQLKTATADNFRTVVLSDGPVPGALGDGFSHFGAPSLNNSGQTAFVGRLTGTEIIGRAIGIWSEGSGNGLGQVASTETSAPGTSADFYNFGHPTLNDSGQTAFYGTYRDFVSINGKGIWKEDKDSELQLIANEGSIAPGTTDAIFSSLSEFDHHVLNNAGHTAFQGYAVNGLGRIGIWSDKGDRGLELIALEGNSVPEIPGATFSDFNTSSDRPDIPALNNSGQIAFWAEVSGQDISDENDTGIWSDREGNGLQLVVREGETAPNVSEATFSGFRKSTLNDAGQIAFHGFLSGPDITSANRYGLWSEGGGNGLQLVARQGDSAPGSLDAKFGYFADSYIAFNSAGHTAFVGTLTGTEVTSSNDTGIWSEGGGNGLQLVAREGSRAPGTSGAKFDQVLHFLSEIVLNSSGKTAFMGFLSGPGIGDSNDAGIWAENQSGKLKLIAREGDMFDVDDGPGVDFRIISNLDFIGDTGNEDGRRSGFNDRGQLAFYATFTDGSSGVFVSNLAAIPEPSGLILLALGSMSLAARYRLICS